MAVAESRATPFVQRILFTEEAIYGLILVSGMVVVAGSAGGSSSDAVLAIAITVVIFYAAHVYAGALSRLAATGGKAGLRQSIIDAGVHSSGLLAAGAVPTAVLALGAAGVIGDEPAFLSALIVNTILLAGLGWVAVARWSDHWSARLVGALISASFGGVLIVLEAFGTH